MQLEWSKLFPKDEWQQCAIPADDAHGLHLVLTSSYAILGLVMVTDCNQLLASWQDSQAFLLKLKNHSADANNKDVYLIMVTNVIPKEHFAAIEKIISDTYGARKLFIERRDRSIEESLADTGLTKYSLKAQESTLQEPILTILGKKLPENALEDLASRSPKTILQNFLDGIY